MHLRIDLHVDDMGELDAAFDALKRSLPPDLFKRNRSFSVVATPDLDPEPRFRAPIPVEPIVTQPLEPPETTEIPAAAAPVAAASPAPASSAPASPAAKPGRKPKAAAAAAAAAKPAPVEAPAADPAEDPDDDPLGLAASDTVAAVNGHNPLGGDEDEQGTAQEDEDEQVELPGQPDDAPEPAPAQTQTQAQAGVDPAKVKEDALIELRQLYALPEGAKRVKGISAEFGGIKFSEIPVAQAPALLARVRQVRAQLSAKGQAAVN